MVANCVAIVLGIGDPRRPITREMAAAIVLINLLLIGLLVWGQP